MQETDPLATKLAEFLTKILNVPVDPNRPDALLIEDYDADSMDLVDIVVRMETQFSLRVPDEQIPHLKTFGDVLGFIKQKTPATPQ